jgi:DNA-binding CsgD family transcriptional regulator
MIGEIPLVGRRDELDRIVSRLVRRDRGGFVIAGAAGVGKSRLAAEAAKAVALKGARTAHVVATRAASTIPFGAFAPLLPELDTDVRGLVNLLRQATDAILQRRHSDQELLLVVDDAHHLDDGSAALVHQLAQADVCQVLATVRTPGRAPDPITALWKDSLTDRLDLAPLAEADVERLAVTTLGGPVSGTAVRWLWETSRGNPMFVRELLVGASEAGALLDNDGVWVLRLPLPAPERLAELVASRLDDLTPETGAVVDLLAVGEPLEFALLESIIHPSAAEDAELQGLVSSRELGRRLEARLSHPLYADVRRQRMPLAKLRRLSSTLARALLDTGARRRDDIVRVAAWQLDAGERGDPELFALAAASARQMFNMGLAARLARAALEAGGGVRAGLALGEAESFSGHHREAEQVLSALVAICADDTELARVASARSYNLGFLMGDKAAAEAVIAEALGSIIDPSARLRLTGRLATIHAYAGELRPAIDDARLLAASADDAISHRGMATAAVALALVGRGDEAVGLARRGLEVHRRCAERTQLPESQYIGSVLAQMAMGHLAEAEAEARIGYGAYLAAGDNDGVATFCVLLGMVHVEQGDLPAAAKRFREGRALYQQLFTLKWCTAGAALAEGMCGHRSEAAAAVVQLDGVPPHWMSALLDADLLDRGRAWAKVAGGEVSLARALLRAGAERAAALEHYAAEARLLHDLARLGEAATVARRLEELSEMVDGELTGWLANHASALARMSCPDLEEAAERLESLGALLLAAEACSEASVACRREGLHRRASAWDRRAADLEARCGGARTPSLVSAGRAEPLTKREREVAHMAASGATTKEIAERLYLSVRTVENHLQHVYSKLGVTSRDDLVPALGGRTEK